MSKLADILFFVVALAVVICLLPVLLEIAFYIVCFVVVANIIHFTCTWLFSGGRTYYEQHTYL